MDSAAALAVQEQKHRKVKKIFVKKEKKKRKRRKKGENKLATRIRLSRAGRRHSPFYHVCVYDIRQRRDAAYVEKLGFYDPANADTAQQISIDVEKAAEWLSKGATPSETVRGILKKSGVELPAKKAAKTRERKASTKTRNVKERTKKRTSNSKDRKAKKKDD
jgi:small subunit ribosomal protein S16